MPASLSLLAVSIAVLFTTPALSAFIVASFITMPRAAVSMPVVVSPPI